MLSMYMYYFGDMKEKEIKMEKDKFSANNYTYIYMFCYMN